MKRSWFLAALSVLLTAPPLAAGPEDGDVTAISVLPGPGRVMVVIDVTGAIEVQDFTLSNPARLVVDVVGASLRAPGVRYDGANRGGILNSWRSVARTPGYMISSFVAGSVLQVPSPNFLTCGHASH